MKIKVTNEKDELQWLCLKCFRLLFPTRALGLTSREAMVCVHCGEGESICVLLSKVKIASAVKELE